MSKRETPIEPDGPRRLVDALRLWGDQTAIATIAKFERVLPLHILRAQRYPALGIRQSVGQDDARVNEYSELHDDEIEIAYLAWWSRLTKDWQRRVEIGEVGLTGVRTSPEVTTERVTIPGAWAAEFAFDFGSGAASGLGRRYVAIEATFGVGQVTGPNVERGPAAAGGRFDPEIFDVSTLTAEQVAVLLTRHADFVREQGIQLLAPGKASPMALIATKMRERARTNDLEATLAKEAAWLTRWAASVAQAYQIPGAGTIRNKLSGLYRDLRKEFPAPPT